MAKVTGLDRLLARIARIPSDTRTELQAELQRSANDLVALQSSLAPVDRGDLKSSIMIGPGKHELAVKVEAGGPNAHHARFVEFGTAKADAQPFFFFPAYRALRITIRRRLGRAIAKAARKDAST